MPVRDALWSLGSSSVIASVAGLSKLFLWTCTGGLRVNGLSGLLKCLKEEKTGRRGLLTVSNHISILDDPILWGVLPFKEALLDKKTTRWTLAAADICYTNRFYSLFFNLGQNIKTLRGAGCKQPATDEAIRLLRAGLWVHIFSEGKVHQPRKDIEDPYDYELLRFKWGVARMLMDGDASSASIAGPPTPQPSRQLRPWVLPIWITGMDRVFPEDRGFPRFLPRLGASISITFGAPINDRVEPILDRWRHRKRPLVQDLAPYQQRLDDEEATRSHLASVLREEVARLGKDLKHGRGDGTTGGNAAGFGGEKVQQGDFVTGTKWGQVRSRAAGLGFAGLGVANAAWNSRAYSSSSSNNYAKEANMPFTVAPSKPNTSHLERTSAEPRGRNVFMAEIISIKKETEHVKSFRFRILRSLEDNTVRTVQVEPFSFRAGQWLDVYIPGMETVGGFSLTTSFMEYTMSQGEFELAIQAAQHPPAHWFSHKAVLGSRVAVRVGGRFCWPPVDGLSPLGSQGSLVKHDEVVCIAGGVGINPLISIMEEIVLRNVTAERHIRLRLLYSAKSLDELLFVDRIKKCRIAKDRLSYFLTSRDLQEEGQVMLPDATIYDRRISDDDLHSAIRANSQTEDETGQLFYICGPPEMTDHISKWLVDPTKGRVSKARVHFEKWW